MNNLEALKGRHTTALGDTMKSTDRSRPVPKNSQKNQLKPHITGQPTTDNRQPKTDNRQLTTDNR